MQIKNYTVVIVDSAVVAQGAGTAFAALTEAIRALETVNSDVALYEVNLMNGELKATFLCRPKSALAVLTGSLIAS